MNKVCKRILIGLISVFLGYIFHYYVMAEILSRFYNVSFAFTISLVCCVSGVMIILDGIFVTKHINNKVLFGLECAYIVFLMMLLFDRSVIETDFIINPIPEIKCIILGSSDMLYQSLLNLLAFIPFGYFFKDGTFKNMIVKMLAISLMIEVVQVGLQIGFFDTFDIILYLLGCSIGFVIFKKFKLNVDGKEIHIIPAIKKLLCGDRRDV